MRIPTLLLLSPPLLTLAFATACGDKDDNGDEICDDSLDNDGNGLADCADPACADFPACSQGDGGAADGGAMDGGATDGGTADGGATDGGATDGGATDGGATDGGSGDGGSADGGSTEPPPQLWINEFMASNATVIADESGGYADWIELYNPNADPVSLGDWTITDDLAEPDKFTLDASLVVPAEGFLLLWADDDEEDGANHLPFKLSAKGEAVGIYGPDGSSVDHKEFGAQSTDISAGRVTDGGTDWTLFTSPTPGTSNVPG